MPDGINQALAGIHSNKGRCVYGAQNETYNDGKDVKWWNALSAKELRV